jgi:hypothetical protein
VVIGYAQDTTKTIRYIIEKDSSNIYIEIFPVKGDKKQTIYFLTAENDSSKNILDTCFQNFVNSTAVNTSIVKIIFTNKPSVEVPNLIKAFANILVKEIIPNVQQKYPLFVSNNIILAGINEGAIIAIGTASLWPEKINKTAAFFYNYILSITTYNDLVTLVPAIKGKLFLHTNYKDDGLSQSNLLADSLALKSTIMLYKVDDDETFTNSTLLADGYHWLMADGNNYIIKLAD